MLDKLDTEKQREKGRRQAGGLKIKTKHLISINILNIPLGGGVD
jgi:hypothetical protein